MPRGQPKICTKCGRKHWSISELECPWCREHSPERPRRGGPALRVLDHDPEPSSSVVRLNGGRCIGGLHAAEKRCGIHWRRLSHRHCPTVACGRAMSVLAKQCGACTALEIFEPQARELREIVQPDPVPDPFAGIDHYTDRAHEEYLADMIGLPVAVAL